MAHLEKRLRKRDPELFIANGTIAGEITVNSVLGFKVKQIVTVVATGLPPLELEVKQIDSINTMFVGPIKGPIVTRTDISAYTVAIGANIFALEQPSPSIPEQHVERITYEEEPVVARRVFVVDQLGDPYTSSNPFPVDAVVNVSEINIELDAKDGSNVAISSHSAPIFSEASSTITTSNYEEIFSYTSTNSLTRIVALDVAVSTSAIVVAKINGVIVKTKRSSALNRNITIQFHEHRPIPNGSTLTVEAKVDLVCGKKIWPTYEAFTSMDGYIA